MEKYETLEFEVIRFEAADVITGSATTEPLEITDPTLGF